MRILILKPSSLGDVVQALPVLRLLKAHWPASEIHWWLSAHLLPLLRDDPDLSGIFPFERQRWASPWHWDEMLQSVRDMRARHFDYVIDLQGLARSGIFAWLARGSTTIGLDDPREGARAFYDLAVARPSYLTHAVDWYLEVLREMQIPVHWNFCWLPQHTKTRQAIVEKWGIEPSTRWIIIHPGARWSNKRWPVESYQQVIRRILPVFPDVHIAVLGGKDDQGLASALASVDAKRCLNLAGKTSLLEMIEWIRLSRVMISNDSGPMHVGAALGKSVVAIFGPTEPRRTGPYGQLHHVVRRDLPCAPCMKDSCSNIRTLECLHTVEAATVFAQIARQLA